AEAVAQEYSDIFGKNNFFIELQDHGIPEQKATNPKLIAIARKLNIGLVVTNDCHYLLREHSEAHELFLCIGTQTTMQNPKRFKFPNDQFYFKSPDEMAKLFPQLPEAMENTVKIAERCHVHLPTVKDDEANHYPEYPMKDGEDRAKYLRDICLEGIPWRYQLNIEKDKENPHLKEIIKRMDYELGIIKITGFESYFLVVWDFLHYAAKIGVPLGPGRGSGAGSIVAYLLGITHIDPLTYGLLFERFLNPDRVSPPDFDIDLCERRRHEVIEYVRDKYGADRVVQIGTFGTLKAKAVIKDVARAMGRSVQDSTMLTKLIPTDPKMTLQKALDGDPGHNIPPSEELKHLLETEPWVQELWKYAKVLEGKNRNMSIHAAGVIIGDQPVANIAPIARGAGNEPITQFSAVPCESLGLLKMDFLGLKTLTLIQDALDLIKKNTGRHIESNDIPIDDENTYKLLQKGDTIAVFQLESGGMQNLCQRFGVTNIKDIIALIALYRPGPMQFLDEFIGRKFGKIPLDYDVPEMEPILSETYGIMLYQEQVMQVVQVVAGFTLGNADILRRAMGKKKIKAMKDQFVDFQKGCRKNGISDDVSQNIWDKILKFAGYGFNKSHSAAYGMLSYRTAWLKANYPAEYMAAILTNELGNSEKLSFYLKACRDMNINILAPDVNICDSNFSVDGPNIRFGLSAVKGVGSAIVDGIVKAREEGGKFKDIVDFCKRVDGNSKRNMENLIKAGAMDCFGLHRSQLMAVYEDAYAMAQQDRKDKAKGQGSLFDLLDDSSNKATDLFIPDIEEWDKKEILKYEKELTGFYLSGHPIFEAQKLLDASQLDDLSDIAQMEPGTMVRIGAYISEVMQKTTKKDNKPWVIMTLENRESNIEALLFSNKYQTSITDFPGAIAPEQTVIAEGELVRREGETKSKLFVDRIIPINLAPIYFTRAIHIRIHEKDATPENLEQLQNLCQQNPGETKVIFGLICENGYIVYVQNETIQIKNTAEFRTRITALFGTDTILQKKDKKRPVKKVSKWQSHKKD
ncbi:MAG: DNA polymerase III subunit alpha, partial [Lentisphaeria bacterium]